MALKDKISLYDTNGKLGEGGRSVAETQAGDFQENNFRNTDDHLVDLLNKRVRSDSTGQVYPNDYYKPFNEDLDIEGLPNNGYFHEVANPQKYQGKQIEGVDLHEHLLTQTYQYNYGTAIPEQVGPAPGPTGHSTHQDMDGIDYGFQGRYSNPDTGETYS